MIEVFVLDNVVISLQSAQAALIAAILFVFGRGARHQQLRGWGWSWAALSLYYAVLVALLPVRAGAGLHPGRVLAAPITLCSATWLLHGTLALLDRPVRRPRLWTAVAIVGGLASVLLPLLGGQPLVRGGGGWLARCLTAGTLYIVSAVLLAKHSGRAAVGRVLLPAAFLLYGLKLFYYLGVALSDILAGAPRFTNLALIGVSDLWLQATMAVGTVVWLLEREHEELKELDRLKSDLLANVSHELRTPLTSIVGYTDLLQDRSLGALTDRQQSALGIIRRNADRLSRRVAALLDFARIDAGRAAVVARPFALAPLAEQVVTHLRPEAAKAGLTLALALDADLPPVIGDGDKLAQVLDNLVANAVKFTPSGGSVTVSARRLVSAEQSAVEIAVSDTGGGIPADQVERVFERFYQIDASTTRRAGGLGLGLAIVKSILDAHGAPVRVESALGQGSRFSFVLPLHEQARPMDAEGAPAAAQARRVLVVDDDDDVQRLVRAELHAAGFDVLSAWSAEEGATLAERERPDLVLLDLVLPDRSGLDLLQSLKTRSDTAGIPVLVMSSSNERTRALSLGAVDYLRKPVCNQALVALTRRLLHDTPRAVPATILVVDDEPDTVDLLHVTLAAQGWRVLSAYDGPQALALLERERPGLILLDLMLPGLSGFEVLEALGRDDETARIPVVVLSARGDDASVRRGLALGARRFLSKPFELRALVAEVQRQLAAGTRPRATSAS